MNIESLVYRYPLETATVFKLILATVFGGLIGLEREMKGRPAGLKTFSLVCIGATLVMITNEYIGVRLNLGGDSARMAAQVISGVGFLGAGTIMVTGQNQVKGLTTAAALWVTAALGISIGTGFYFGSLVSVIIIYITSFSYRYLDQKIVANSRALRIYIEGETEDFLLMSLDYFRKNRIRIGSLTRKPENMWHSSHTCAIIELTLLKRRSHEAILQELLAIDGVIYIEEI